MTALFSFRDLFIEKSMGDIGLADIWTCHLADVFVGGISKERCVEIWHHHLHMERKLYLICTWKTIDYGMAFSCTSR